MRAKLPNKDGFVERDGVKLHYEIYGDGPETMVFLQPWIIVHSRIYKAQLPYFSERFRCIAYDGRGNGKSDRPKDAAAYSLEDFVADALAVMDATDAGKAILVGLSYAFVSLPGGFLPVDDQGFITTDVQTPSDSSYARTESAVEKVEKYLLAKPGV